MNYPISTYLLRFEQRFHDAYIFQSDRHDSFELVNHRNLEKKLKEIYENFDCPWATKRELNAIKQRMLQHPKDAFYIAVFRAIENNIVMRLRAWGPKVEVLFPPKLKRCMQDDLADTMAIDQS